MITRAAVVAEARNWVDVKWRHQGRNANGVDCVGLIVMVCQTLGLSDYDSTNYGRDPDPMKFLPHFTNGGAVRINPKDAKDGDLVIFRQDKFPCHSGILATMHGARSVIHAHAGRHKVKEELVPDDAPIVACYHLPGVED
jgi:cell wall-associated NlpC family hydrolase